MLRGIHKATSNWLGKAILSVVMGLLIVSFAVWGIGDIFRGFGRNAVAKIGNTEISIEQFRQFYTDRVQQIGRQVGRALTPDQARGLGLDRQILSQIVAETTLDEYSRKLRLGLSDAEISRRITSDPSFRGLNGQFDARASSSSSAMPFSEPRYVDQQRRDTLRRQIVKHHRRDESADDRAVRDQSIPERETQHRISALTRRRPAIFRRRPRKC